MKFFVEPELQNVLRVGVIIFNDMITPDDSGDAIWQLFSSLSDALHREYAGRTVAEVPGVQDARMFYRAVGIDPTKTRPSSEALLRRSIKGKGVYRIHPLVDLLNYVSLKQLLPVGLYDLSKIDGGAISIRMGASEWGFDGIRKARVNVSGRMCVVDNSGPFGSPTSDSLRTSIEGEVPGALVLLYQSQKGDAQYLMDSLHFTAQIVCEYMGGRVTLLESL